MRIEARFGMTIILGKEQYLASVCQSFQSNKYSELLGH
jgi:hypothetical protein